jgi:hypothetical protein
VRARMRVCPPLVAIAIPAVGDLGQEVQCICLLPSSPGPGRCREARRGTATATANQTCRPERPGHAGIIKLSAHAGRPGGPRF